jgi:hypothetical protein
MPPIRFVLRVVWFRSEDGFASGDEIRLTDAEWNQIGYTHDAAEGRANGWNPAAIARIAAVGLEAIKRRSIPADRVVSFQVFKRDETKCSTVLGFTLTGPEDSLHSPVVWMKKGDWRLITFSQLVSSLGTGHARVEYLMEQWKSCVGVNCTPERPKQVLLVPKPAGGSSYAYPVGPYDILNVA